jgi:hypothetical protein
MKLSKTHLGDGGIERLAEAERQERQVALEYIAEAWNTAEDDGIATQALAHASLFAAITSLVEQHGETAISELIATLPDRIQAGEYSLTRSLQ